MDVAAQLDAALSGRYRIEREIGAGGMATVYLARDLKHNRNVALKVLRPELAAILGPERFLSEINVTANLQHPHLLPLFDSGEANGLLFYVMPFVTGESLRDRLEREHQLPIDEAVRIAVAVLSALDCAHRHNIIHRDLKPENILLQDGQPVVADFGIALAISKAGGARVTETGLSLGTPQYMSPEQATGDRGIDARSDIYSIAAVLYEMLLGDPPHKGRTAQAIIARLLSDRPQHPRVIRETVPEHVDTAVMHALAKLPADRFASASEFAAALSGTRVVAVPPPPARTTIEHVVPSGWNLVRRAANWAPLIAGMALLAATVFTRREPTPGYPTFFGVEFPDGVNSLSITGIPVALSRDGSQLAFVGHGPSGRAIYLRRLDAWEARPIRGTENGIAPEFSADGTWLLFVLDNKLKKVPIDGGPPITIADSVGNRAVWGERGNILFQRASGIVMVTEEGGHEVWRTGLDSTRGHRAYRWPFALPGGKAALITIYKNGLTPEHARLGVLRLSNKTVTELGIAGLCPRYLPSGHVVFGRADGSVFAAPFSLARRKLTGPAVPVLEQVDVGGGGALHLATSDNGTVVYQTGAGGASELVRVNRKGEARSFMTAPKLFTDPRIDPSGRRVAVSITVSNSRSDLWIYDLTAGTRSLLTRDTTSERPEWTPDGRRVAYFSAGAVGRSRWKPWDGGGTEEPFVDDTAVFEVSLSRKGKYLAVRRGVSGFGGNPDIWIAPIDSPQSLRPFLVTSAAEATPVVSPDGRWLAYFSNETGSPEVYVTPLPGPGGRVPVSRTGGVEPVWSPDGRELFYRSPGFVMAATITTSPELDVTRRDTLFADEFVDGHVRTVSHANYDVFPSGQEFMFVRNLDSRQRGLFGIANWTEELKRRTRSNPVLK